MQNHIEINAELVRDILAYIRVWKRVSKVYAKKEKIFAKQIS
jgi:hypothetical protein